MTTIEQYRAIDARISIGLPILQDNQELEYPGFIDDILIAFYRNIPEADSALQNILEAGALIIPDTDYAPVGWSE
jgi:hypothetical protein